MSASPDGEKLLDAFRLLDEGDLNPLTQRIVAALG
jgi:hypothetical protein